MTGVTGTGLGLAIVKTVVELHGGEVFAERLNGEHFRLPPPSPARPLSQPPCISQRRGIQGSTRSFGR